MSFGCFFLVPKLFNCKHGSSIQNGVRLKGRSGPEYFQRISRNGIDLIQQTLLKPCGYACPLRGMEETGSTELRLARARCPSADCRWQLSLLERPTSSVRNPHHPLLRLRQRQSQACDLQPIFRDITILFF